MMGIYESLTSERAATRTHGRPSNAGPSRLATPATHRITTRHRVTHRADARWLRSLSMVVLLLACVMLPAADAAWEYGDWSKIFEPVTDVQDPAICPDGAGGMFLIIGNQDPDPDGISVSHVDHTGTETWGDGGIFMPVHTGAAWQAWPVAVAPDNAGGLLRLPRELRAILRGDHPVPPAVGRYGRLGVGDRQSRSASLRRWRAGCQARTERQW